MPFGTDLVLGNIDNEDVRDQIKTKWGIVEGQWVTAINNLMHNDVGVKDLLESAEEEDELPSKFLPVEYNNPIKSSETPCITVITLYEDPATDPTIQQICRRVGYQPQAVPQAPAQVPQAVLQAPQVVLHAPAQVPQAPAQNPV